ncbi:SRPBCC domain-containing protein [Microbacterium sp. 4R-513]|uniref:SRPBCC domain-containing protein n=1 Tax=Microbacterium sp. 4R-513 TaxID=2567934 RepID=UPI0013E15C2B|nr:SRPBCC domain-containing protein [Microbacterium sp. 4R-513]QIG40075.1 SRPBCC domain-containing protein [Microbacterium sp. 4R-513]
MADNVARADIDVEASPEKVWDIITTHASDVNFGAAVESDWTPGSPIVWRGEWNGKSFEDRGEIIEVERPRRLVLTHYSPMSGAEDTPENRHRLTYELSERDSGTHIEFTQDGNASESARAESEKNWRQHLAAVKEQAES